MEYTIPTYNVKGEDEKYKSFSIPADIEHERNTQRSLSDTFLYSGIKFSLCC